MLFSGLVYSFSTAIPVLNKLRQTNPNRNTLQIRAVSQAPAIQPVFVKFLKVVFPITLWDLSREVDTDDSVVTEYPSQAFSLPNPSTYASLPNMMINHISF